MITLRKETRADSGAIVPAPSFDFRRALPQGIKQLGGVPRCLWPDDPQAYAFKMCQGKELWPFAPADSIAIVSPGYRSPSRDWVAVWSWHPTMKGSREISVSFGRFREWKGRMTLEQNADETTREHELDRSKILAIHEIVAVYHLHLYDGIGHDVTMHRIIAGGSGGDSIPVIGYR